MISLADVQNESHGVRGNDDLVGDVLSAAFMVAHFVRRLLMRRRMLGLWNRALVLGLSSLFIAREASANPTVEPDKLYLRTGTVHTPAEANLVAPVTAAFETGRRYVVQLDGPMTPAQHSTLQQIGAVLEGYLPMNAYIAQLDQAAPGALAGLGFVQWVGA